MQSLGKFTGLRRANYEEVIKMMNYILNTMEAKHKWEGSIYEFMHYALVFIVKQNSPIDTACSYITWLGEFPTHSLNSIIGKRALSWCCTYQLLNPISKYKCVVL